MYFFCSLITENTLEYRSKIKDSLKEKFTRIVFFSFSFLFLCPCIESSRLIVELIFFKEFFIVLIKNHMTSKNNFKLFIFFEYSSIVIVLTEKQENQKRSCFSENNRYLTLI